MPDIAFREYLPYYKSVESSPIIVSDAEPAFTLLNELVITDSLPVGAYSFTVTWEWSMSDTNDSALFRFISPISIGTIYRYEPKDNNDLVLRTASSPFDWGGGPITVTFEGSITSGGSPLSVFFSSIELERKS